jgi:phenylpyruvate tautomerase PptA (4-oxalocrotonate tautomerase family)
MPYIRIETSQPLDDAANAHVLKETSAFMSGLLGKPEKVIMVSVVGNTPMMFNGDAQPAAYVHIKSIGLTADKCGAYSKAIGEFIQSTLKVSPERTYIDFAAIDGTMFGWNGQTF